jgi:hypothetical protein
MRNTGILEFLGDDQYADIFNRLRVQSSMDFPLLAEKEFMNFFKRNVPTVRCVVPQVARWLVLSIDKEKGKGRCVSYRLGGQ